jgi:HTH-type transcriptional regulator/antitoxin HigA
MERTPQPIQDEAEYEAALAEVASLLGAAAGTPEGERLDALTVRIEAYEARIWPIDAAPLEDSPPR